jgi:hypothetical protein
MRVDPALTDLQERCFVLPPSRLFYFDAPVSLFDGRSRRIYCRKTDRE